MGQGKPKPSRAPTDWYVVLTDIDDVRHAEDGTRVSGRNLTLIISPVPALAWSASAEGRAEFFNQGGAVQ